MLDKVSGNSIELNERQSVIVKILRYVYYYDDVDSTLKKNCFCYARCASSVYIDTNIPDAVL